MKNSSFNIFALLCLLLCNLLAGCSATYETYYEFESVSNVDVQNCISYCTINKNHCHKLCRGNEKLCNKSEINEANIEISGYVKDKQDKNITSENEANNVLHTLQCDNAACDCDKDHRICYKMCGGKVIKKERCIANCPESWN